MPYSGNVWWEESLANLANHYQFTKLKSSTSLVTINNVLADPFIHQIFCQNLYSSTFAKHYCCQSFPLYSSLHATNYSEMFRLQIYLLKMLCCCRYLSISSDTMPPSGCWKCLGPYNIKSESLWYQSFALSVVLWEK